MGEGLVERKRKGSKSLCIDCEVELDDAVVVSFFFYGDFCSGSKNEYRNG